MVRRLSRKKAKNLRYFIGFILLVILIATNAARIVITAYEIGGPETKNRSMESFSFVMLITIGFILVVCGVGYYVMYKGKLIQEDGDEEIRLVNRVVDEERNLGGGDGNEERRLVVRVEDEERRSGGEAEEQNNNVEGEEVSTIA